ncbi:MAG: DUF4886 domain-containing protein [Oscillospiraceae bacterium]|nr:DUF4886 domain-containing protein [Oscillospiraceae bacterium]
MNILAIGNSFSSDATRYLHQIAREAGVTLSVASLYIGGCSLERHYRNMLSDSHDYVLVYNGMSTGFHVSIKEALLNREWDVVTVQQQSGRSPKADTYHPYMEQLCAYVRKCQPKAKLVVHQTWAYEQGSEMLLSAGYADHRDMFADLQRAYAQAAETVHADGIIPSGQLFQNMLAAGFESVQRDTYHASLGAGRYALGLLWYRMLTGNSVLDNAFCDFDEPVSRTEVEIIKGLVEEFTALMV